MNVVLPCSCSTKISKKKSKIKKKSQLVFSSYFFSISSCCSTRKWPPTPPENSVHQHAAARAGEGVPLQQVPLPPEEDRDRGLVGPDGAPSQGLVPEPSHEAQTASPGAKVLGVGRRRFDSHLDPAAVPEQRGREGERRGRGLDGL